MPLLMMPSLCHQRLAGEVCSEYKKAKGGSQSLELSKKSKRFHSYEGETVDLVELREQKELIKDEILEWKKSTVILSQNYKNFIKR